MALGMLIVVIGTAVRLYRICTCVSREQAECAAKINDVDKVIKESGVEFSKTKKGNFVALIHQDP